MANDIEKLDLIIVIGSTGLGKSTIIKSHCKSEAIVTSSSARSCTKEPKIFIESDDEIDNDDAKDNDNPTTRIWLDTMGAEDDSRELKDEDILSGVMQMLIDYVPKSVQLRIKILWVVGRVLRYVYISQITLFEMLISLTAYGNTTMYITTMFLFVTQPYI